MKILIDGSRICRALPDDAILVDGCVTDSTGHEYAGGLSSRLQLIAVPDQELTMARLAGEDAPLQISAKYPDDVVLYSAEEQRAKIDSETGAHINRAVHTACGVDETLGILRDQLVQIINTLGLTPTVDFAHLNDVALAAIADGAAKKAAL